MPLLGILRAREPVPIQIRDVVSGENSRPGVCWRSGTIPGDAAGRRTTRAPRTASAVDGGGAGEVCGRTGEEDVEAVGGVRGRAAVDAGEGVVGGEAVVG